MQIVFVLKSIITLNYLILHVAGLLSRPILFIQEKCFFKACKEGVISVFCISDCGLVCRLCVCVCVVSVWCWLVTISFPPLCVHAFLSAFSFCAVFSPTLLPLTDNSTGWPMIHNAHNGGLW